MQENKYLIPFLALQSNLLLMPPLTRHSPKPEDQGACALHPQRSASLGINWVKEYIWKRQTVSSRELKLHDQKTIMSKINTSKNSTISLLFKTELNIRKWLPLESRKSLEKVCKKTLFFMIKLGTIRVFKYLLILLDQK